MTRAEAPVILFDALCPPSSAHARFILRHDRRGPFRLARMQDAAGAALCRRSGIDPADPETLIVVAGDEAWRDSDAVIAIRRGLGWPWRLAGLAGLAPRAACDPLCRRVARHRYRLFGRRTGRLPDAGLRKRML